MQLGMSAAETTVALLKPTSNAFLATPAVHLREPALTITAVLLEILAMMSTVAKMVRTFVLRSSNAAMGVAWKVMVTMHAVLTSINCVEASAFLVITNAATMVSTTVKVVTSAHLMDTVAVMGIKYVLGNALKPVMYVADLISATLDRSADPAEEQSAVVIQGIQHSVQVGDVSLMNVDAVIQPAALVDGHAEVMCASTMYAIPAGGINRAIGQLWWKLM